MYDAPLPGHAEYQGGLTHAARGPPWWRSDLLSLSSIRERVATAPCLRYAAAMSCGHRRYGKHAKERIAQSTEQWISMMVGAEDVEMANRSHAK